MYGDVRHEVGATMNIDAKLTATISGICLESIKNKDEKVKTTLFRHIKQLARLWRARLDNEQGEVPDHHVVLLATLSSIESREYQKKIAETDILTTMRSNNQLTKEQYGKAINLRQVLHSIYRALWYRAAKWDSSGRGKQKLGPGDVNDLTDIKKRDWSYYKYWTKSCSSLELHCVEQLLIKDKLLISRLQEIQKGLDKWPDLG